jgi:hypothetical protein
MVLDFKAVQSLNLPVLEHAERLPQYLQQEARVVGALLSPQQLSCLGPGRFRYEVRPLQLFQLRILPVVELRATHTPGRLELHSVSCSLEGVPGLTEDFNLTLSSWLEAAPQQLMGEAQLRVQVSQPTVLKLIPRRALEATGESLLNGILLSIKGRVGQQLIGDFNLWCQQEN